MLTATSYRAYLRHQAQNHPLLLHADDNLVFQMASIEQAYGDLKSPNFSGSGFLMRGIEPAYRFGLGADGLLRQTFDGGVMVCKRFSQREEGTAGFRAAQDASERVCLDMLEKITADSTAGHPFFEYAADDSLSVTSRPRIGMGDGTFAGWLMIFSFNISTNFCSPAARTVWADGGQTPSQV